MRKRQEKDYGKKIIVWRKGQTDRQTDRQGVAGRQTDRRTTQAKQDKIIR